METYMEGDRIRDDVCQFIRTQPRVFKLLFDIQFAQTHDASRFNPPPTWFLKNGTTIDLPLFASTVREFSRVDTTSIGMLTDDAVIVDRYGDAIYNLLRFVVYGCALRLEHVKLADVEKFKVVHNGDREKQFMRLDEPIQYLYHGSPLQNWHSIMRNGLKVMSGTPLMTTGAVYGNGIYLSDSLLISYSYSRKTYATSGIIIGVYEVYNGDQYKKTTNIFVVPDENKLLLRYLLYFENSNKYPNITSIGDGLNASLAKAADGKRQAQLSMTKKAAVRIAKELESLRVAGRMVEPVSDSVFLVDNRVLEFPYDFPFGTPTVDGSTVVGWSSKSRIADIMRE